MHRRLSRRRRAHIYARLVRAHVASVMGVLHRDLMAPSRLEYDKARARQIAMYLTHVVFRVNLTQTGVAFARDRATVRYACRAIEEAREDSEFDDTIEKLTSILRAEKPKNIHAQIQSILGREGVPDAGTSVA